MGVADGRDLRERDVAPTGELEEQVSHVIDIAKLACGFADDLALGRADAPRGDVLVRVSDRLNDLEDGQPVGAQALLVDDDLDLADEPAGDVYGGQPGDREELGPEAELDPVPQRDEVAGLGGEPGLVDRLLLRVELPDRGRVGLLGELPTRALEVLRGVLEREVDVGAVGEVQRDADAPFLISVSMASRSRSYERGLSGFATVS